MPEKDPVNWQWLVFLAFGSGAFGRLVKHREHAAVGKRFNLWSFLFDIATSSVIGALGFAVAYEGGAPLYFSAAVAGFLGNLGSRVFDLARLWLANRLGIHPKDTNPK